MAEAGSTKPYDFSSFYRAFELSDVELVLRDEGCHHGGCGGACMEELAGHGVVLAAASPVFKAQLTRWQEQPSSERSARWRRPVITLQVQSCEQLGAARALVEFIYKQRLPDRASQQLLLDMLELADQYDVQKCAAACAEALSKQELEWDTVMQLLLRPPPYTDDPALAALLSRVDGRISDKLQQHLGDLEQALASNEGRECFLALPLKGVELLLRDGRTCVACENTVLVAVTLWVQQHRDSLTAGDRKRLAELIRLPHLSPFAGFGLASTMPWLVEALGAGVVAAAMGCAAVLSKDEPDAKRVFEFAGSNRWPASWKYGRRPQSHQKATLDWKVSLQELQRTYSSGEAALSPGAAFGGLQWHMAVFGPSVSRSSMRVALVHQLGSSLRNALLRHSNEPEQLPVAIVRGSLVAVRPGLGAAAAAGAAVLSNGVTTFHDGAPSVWGVRAADIWGLGFMPEWDPQRFDGWVGSYGQLTLRLEVAEFL